MKKICFKRVCSIFLIVIAFYLIIGFNAIYADSFSPNKKACLNYIKENAVNPSSYVINKLKDYDIVILGEMHEQKDTLDFIAENIPRLYHEGGVRVFATEFIRSHNNEAINEIVTASEFDYERVVAIYRDFAWLWGFKGYMDIIESIWNLNHSLTEKEAKLRIVGLDFEWLDWSGAKLESDSDRDFYMANMFINSYQKGNGKAIIHTGFTHSMGIYWKMGYYLRQEFVGNTFQICLHHDYNLRNLKISGKDFFISRFIDGIYAENKSQPMGFDITGSPFANIRDSISDCLSYDKNTVFGTVTQGYIIFKPLKEIKRTPFIENFIDNTNFEKAKELIKTRGWFEITDDISITELNQKLDRFMSLIQ